MLLLDTLIPAGTGLREYDDLIVGSREEFEKLEASKAEEF
jgi:DNA-directed RNA polymerase subunit beta'